MVITALKSLVLSTFLILSESFTVEVFKSNALLKSVKSHRSDVCKSTSLSAADASAATDEIVARKMGGFERLLARITPNTKGEVSLSHGTAFVLKGSLSQQSLESAVIHVLRRHEILRAYISSKSRDTWLLSQEPLPSLASRILSTKTVDAAAFESEWQHILDQSLNGPCFAATGPLWRLENIISSSQQQSAWVFTFNHAMDDQQSVNSIVNDIIKYQSQSQSQSNDNTQTQKQVSNNDNSDESNSSSSSNNRSNSNDNDNSSFKTFPFPPSIEEAIAPTTDINGYTLKTLKWTLYQLFNGLAGAVVVPNHIKKKYQFYLQEPTLATDENLYHHYANPSARKTFCKTFVLDKETTEGVRKLSKLNGVSVVHTLSAAMLFLTSALIQSYFVVPNADTESNSNSYSSSGKATSTAAVNMKLRFLLSVSLRPYASIQYKQQQQKQQYKQQQSTTTIITTFDDKDWAKDTAAAAAGALDYITTVPALALEYLSPPSIASSSSSPLPTSSSDSNSNNSNNNINNSNTNIEGTDNVSLQQQQSLKIKLSPSNVHLFWSQAKSCSQQSRHLIEVEEYVPESVRLFGLGMSIPGLDILKAVENDAAGTSAFGRSYSCGVSNVGVVIYESMAESTSSGGTTPSLSVERAYYGTSHGRNGVLSLLSTMTVNQCLNGCLQFTNPLTTCQEAENFRQNLIALLHGLVAYEQEKEKEKEI